MERTPAVNWALDVMRSHWKHCCPMMFWKSSTQCFGVDLIRKEWKEANESRSLKEFQEDGGSVIQRSKSSVGELVLESKTLFWRQKNNTC